MTCFDGFRQWHTKCEYCVIGEWRFLKKKKKNGMKRYSMNFGVRIKHSHCFECVQCFQCFIFKAAEKVILLNSTAQLQINQSKCLSSKNMSNLLWKWWCLARKWKPKHMFICNCLKIVMFDRIKHWIGPSDSWSLHIFWKQISKIN